jgi:GNAT superfamily N-acetyltransferase
MLELRPPREGEWRICRMLLPETFADAALRTHLLAVDTESRRVVGAAAFRRNADEITHFRAHVIPSQRRRGIGSEIVARVAAGAAAIEGTSEITREHGAAEFCARNGFERVESLTTVEGEIAALREYFARLRGRVSLPPGARTVPLHDAPLDQVAALHRRHVAQSGDEGEWRALVAETPGMTRSTAVMVGDRVAGILLWELEGTTVVVRSRVVAPGLRGAWVNVVLMADATETVWAAGARRVRFFYTNTNRDTEKLAGRFGAEITSVLVRFRKG